MKQARQLQMVWISFLISALLLGGISGWLIAHGPSWSPTQPGRWIATVLLVVTVIDLGIALGFFFVKWQPLCEQALKLVWAGRLTSPSGARTVTQQLAGMALIIMALCETPSAYAVVLAGIGVGQPSLVWGLIAASVVGLWLFFWNGLQPASGIFHHAERIAGS